MEFLPRVASTVTSKYLVHYNPVFELRILRVFLICDIKLKCPNLTDQHCSQSSLPHLSTSWDDQSVADLLLLVYIFSIHEEDVLWLKHWPVLFVPRCCVTVNCIIISLVLCPGAEYISVLFVARCWLQCYDVSATSSAVDLMRRRPRHVRRNLSFQRSDDFLLPNISTSAKNVCGFCPMWQVLYFHWVAFT